MCDKKYIMDEKSKIEKFFSDRSRDPFYLSEIITNSLYQKKLIELSKLCSTKAQFFQFDQLEEWKVYFGKNGDDSDEWMNSSHMKGGFICFQRKLYLRNVFLNKRRFNLCSFGNFVIPVIRIDKNLYHLQFPCDLTAKEAIKDPESDFIYAGKYPEENIEMCVKQMKIGQIKRLLYWGIYLEPRFGIIVKEDFPVWGNGLSYGIRIKKVGNNLYWIDPDSNPFKTDTYYCYEDEKITKGNVVNSFELMAKLEFERKYGRCEFNWSPDQYKLIDREMKRKVMFFHLFRMRCCHALISSDEMNYIISQVLIIQHSQYCRCYRCAICIYKN